MEAQNAGRMAAQPRPVMRHRIAVLNRSSVLSDDEVALYTKALQFHVDNHFGPAWGTGAILHFVPKDDTTSWSGQWNLVVLDTSDEANALGYHDLTPEGLPLGKIFAKSDQMYNAKVSVTMCHELDEMLGDPNINLVADDDTRGVFVAYESADAVEADELGYDVTIDGAALPITMSDFVLPNYFVRGSHGPWDFGGHITEPFELAPGGYESVWVPGRGWTQNVRREIGDVRAADRPRVGSRRERRRYRNEWQCSVG